LKLLFKFAINYNELKIIPKISDTSTTLREIDLPGLKTGIQWRIGTFLVNALLTAWWSVHSYEAAGQRIEFYIESYGADALDMISQQRLIVGSAILLILHFLFVYLIYRGAHRSLGLPRTALQDGLIHASRVGLEPFLGILSIMLLSFGSIGFISDLAECRLLGILLSATAILAGLALNLISPIVVASAESGFQQWPLGVWLPVVRKFSPGTFSQIEVVEIRRNGYITAYRLKAISAQGKAHLTLGVVPAAMGRAAADTLALRWRKLLC
jgi:hypothetical protein